MKKKLFSIIFTLLFLFIITACSGTDDTKEEGTTNDNVSTTVDDDDQSTTTTDTTTTTEEDIPDGMTYSDSIQRVSAYVSLMTDILDDGITAYTDNNQDEYLIGQGMVGASYALSLLLPAFTTSFGADGATESAFQISFAFFGFENISYTASNDHYVLEYDNEDYEDGLTHHYALVVDYDEDTDSARILEYKNYDEQDESLENSFEYVKTGDGYAVQMSGGQAIIEISNKQVVSFIMSTYEEEEERTSIYQNSSLIDEDFATEGMDYILAFDGTNYTFTEKEVYHDYMSGQDTKYRINVLEFTEDGTLVDSTEGEWINIE